MSREFRRTLTNWEYPGVVFEIDHESPCNVSITSYEDTKKTKVTITLENLTNCVADLNDLVREIEDDD